MPRPFCLSFCGILAMPTLTTTGGAQITFVAAVVSALADHDASTGEAVTVCTVSPIQFCGSASLWWPS
jgi:hypothetical protein